MARLARLCIAEHLHLVIQRSRGDEPVLAFAGDNDAYLACLCQAAVAANVAIHAFALTPTQVRLLATPSDDSGLGAMMQSAWPAAASMARTLSEEPDSTQLWLTEPVRT